MKPASARSKIGSWSLLVAAVLLLGAAVPASRSRAAGPPPGTEAPRIVLDDLNGTKVDTDTLRGRALVVTFGELNHEGTAQACKDMFEVLGDQRLAHGKVIPLLIVAQDAAPEVLREEAAGGGFPALVLHDPAREAFGRYGILVIPTVVVVDREGVVVHAMPGFSLRFRDLLTSSLLRATGQITAEQFEQAISAGAARPVDPATARANRLAALGDELVRHDLEDLAEERYKEAMRVLPGHEASMLGLGRLLLRQGRMDEGEAVYRSLLTGHPDSIPAQLGLAEVGIGEGGEAMEQSASTLRVLLERSPNLARAHYLLGLVHEKREEWAEASRSYRAACELLLRGQ